MTSKGKRKSTQSKLPVSKEGEIFEQVVDGKKLTFLLKDGELILKEAIILAEKGEKGESRFFRLNPIKSYHRVKYPDGKRYAFNQGFNRPTLRFWQKNVEGSEYDPKKERVVTVVAKDTANSLASMTSIFEEVFMSEKESQPETSQPETSPPKTSQWKISQPETKTFSMVDLDEN